MSTHEVLTVREALEQLSSFLDQFRNGVMQPVALGAHRHREAVLVPAALWDALANERQHIVAQSDASLSMEGLVRSTAARDITDRYIRGEIDVDEMVRLTVALHAQQSPLPAAA